MNTCVYYIENGTGERTPYKVRRGSRIHASLLALLKGPLPAPSPIRRSEHIRQFREAGMLIDTEMRRQADENEYRYGVYHLRSKVYQAKGGQA